MRLLALYLNGISGSNGISARNGLGTHNGISQYNGLSGVNGIRTVNGIIGTDGNLQEGWNSYFLPIQFSDSVLGTNSINPDMLGPSGVGDLSSVPGIENNVLDNRFISPDLKEMLCFEDEANNSGEGITFRDYFSVLVGLSWPPNAEFRLCCSELAGMSAAFPCLEPDFIFSSKPHVEGLQPPIFAPHFLTEMFEAGQQEALTAALIAKFNVLGKTLLMDLTGRFDLGPAGTRFIGGKEPGFDYYLGNAWGNMFLDCSNKDKNNVLCEASTEGDRDIGRDSRTASPCLPATVRVATLQRSLASLVSAKTWRPTSLMVVTGCRLWGPAIRSASVGSAGSTIRRSNTVAPRTYSTST